MTAWWQRAVCKSRTLLLLQEGSSLEAGGQGSSWNHYSVPDLSWQQGGSMVRNTVILQCFDAVGSVTGVIRPVSSQDLTFGNGPDLE